MKINYCTSTIVKGYEVWHRDDIRETIRQHYVMNKLYIVIDDKQSDNRLGVYIASDMAKLCDYIENIFFDGNVIIRAFDNDNIKDISEFLNRM